MFNILEKGKAYTTKLHDNLLTLIQNCNYRIDRYIDKYGECDICGGLFKKDKLFYGKKQVKTRYSLSIAKVSRTLEKYEEDYIYTPQHCINCERFIVASEKKLENT
jgi:hypothetical protein